MVVSLTMVARGIKKQSLTRATWVVGVQMQKAELVKQERGIQEHNDSWDVIANHV
jgi:hypothetical protein